MTQNKQKLILSLGELEGSEHWGRGSGSSQTARQGMMVEPFVPQMCGTEVQLSPCREAS